MFPTLQVSNTSLEIMDWLVENFGGSYYTYKHPTNRRIHSNEKMSYWKVSRIANLALLLARVEPYLVLKRRKAILALKLCRSYDIHLRGQREQTENIKRPNYHVVVGR